MKATSLTEDTKQSLPPVQQVNKLYCWLPTQQRPATTRRRVCCEKLGTSHDVKGFSIGSFLKCIVVERANDDLC